MLEYNSEKKSLFVQCTDCLTLKINKNIMILLFVIRNINKK